MADVIKVQRIDGPDESGAVRVIVEITHGEEVLVEALKFAEEGTTIDEIADKARTRLAVLFGATQRKKRMQKLAEDLGVLVERNLNSDRDVEDAKLAISTIRPGIDSIEIPERRK